jgi:hypothetical protein
MFSSVLHYESIAEPGSALAPADWLAEKDENMK